MDNGKQDILRIFAQGSEDVLKTLPYVRPIIERDYGLQVIVEEGGQVSAETLLHPDNPLWHSNADIVLLSACLEIGNPDITHTTYTNTLQQLIERIRTQLNALVLVFNAASVVGGDQSYYYYQQPDTLALRIRRFNFALIELSIAEGISIVDVDRVSAESGGAINIPTPLHYTDTIHQATAETIPDILADLGVFRRQGAGLFRLEIPTIDKASHQGEVLRWYKKIGDEIKSGDTLADFKVFVQHKQHNPSLATKIFGRKQQVVQYDKLEYRRLVASEGGYLRHIYLDKGEDWRVGDLLAMLTTTNDHPFDPNNKTNSTHFRVTTNRIDPT